MQIPLPQPLQPKPFLDVYGQAAMLPKQLKAADLQNALSQIDVNYNPRKFESEIGLRNAQASEFPSKIELNKAQAAHYPFLNALNAAQAAHYPFLNQLTAAQAEYQRQLPGFKQQELGLEQQRLQYLSGRFGNAHQVKGLLMAMPPAARAAFIAQNPESYNTLVSAYGNKAINELLVSPNFGPVVDKNNNALNFGQLGGGRPDYGNVLSNINQPQTPQQGASPNSLAQGGMPPQQMGMQDQQQQPQTQGYPLPVQAPVAFNPSPETTALIKKSSEMSANKDLTTNTTRKRAEAGIALEHMMQDPVVDDAFNTMAQYSGFTGSFDALLKKVTDPAEAVKIKSAHDQIKRVLAGSIGILEGYPTSEFGASQGLEFFDLSNKAFLQNNYAAAMDYFERGKRAAEAEAKALQSAANPIFNVNNLPGEKGGKVGQVTIQLPDGQTGTIPADKVQDAIKRGAKVVG